MGISNFLKKVYVKVGYRLWGETLWNVWPFTQRVINDWDNYVNLSFSQEGEDLVLSRLIGDKTNGFYVDIGAHHPYRFSNTFKFYLKGWRGINIDPLPGSKLLLDSTRKRDINLEVGVSKSDGSAFNYYMFSEPAYNTFNEEIALERKKSNNIIFSEEREIVCHPLSILLSKHLPPLTPIDFMTIDVEGMDLEVLDSNNWELYKPNYIVVESFNSILKDDFQSNIYNLLNSLKYELISKTANSLIFHLSE